MRNLIARSMTTLAGLALLLGTGGCGLDVLGLQDLFGGSSSTDSVYFSVYNFYQNPVRAEVTYSDRDGITHTLPVAHGDTSPIPAYSRGTLTINVEDLTRQSNAVIRVTFSFPNDDNAQVFVDIQRGDLPDNCRVRMGVLGPSAEQIGWFPEPT